jgi:hypothetical protein
MPSGKCPTCSVVLIEENCAPSVMKRNARVDGSYGPPRGECRKCHDATVNKFRSADPKSWLLYASRQRSKQRGWDNTLTLNDVPDIPKRCPVFPWIILEYKIGVGRSEIDSSPSLDRIDNTKGYVKRNVRVISHRANNLKSDASDKELAALGVDATKRKT